MKNNSTKILIAVIALSASGAVAAWQFYLFVVFKGVGGVADLQGGRFHLWFAIGTAFITCLAGVLLTSKFLSYDRRNEMHIASQGHPLGVRRTSRS